MKKRILSTAIALGLLAGAVIFPCNTFAAAGTTTILKCEKADLDKAAVIVSDNKVVSNNLDTKDKKEGEASIALGVKAGNKINYCDLQINDLNIDVGATFSDLNIEFWLYINNIDNLSTNPGESVIELGSSSELDKQRVLWDLGFMARLHNLKSGWNKLSLTVGAANIQSVNFSKLSRFRLICYQTNADLIVKLDDVKFVPVVPSTDPLLFDAESYDPYLYIVHTDSNINHPVFDTDAKEGKYSIAAVTKGGAGNIPAMLMTHGGLPAPIFNFGDVSDKSVEAWIYVSDIKYLAESRIEFGSSGSDQRNAYWFWLHGKYEKDGKEVNVSKLKTGWNKIKIPFSEAMKKGNPKPEKINWVRIYGVGTGEVPLTFKFDDVKITDPKANPSVNSSQAANSVGAVGSNPRPNGSKADQASSAALSSTDDMSGLESSAIIGSDSSNEAANSENGSAASAANQKKDKKNRTGLIAGIIVVAVLLLAGIGIGGFLYFKKAGGFKE